MKSNWGVLVSRAAFVPAAVLAAFFVCPDASAQGFLAGGAVGFAKQYDYEVGGPIATSDATAPAYRVFAGYYFVPVMAVAMSYVDLGTVKYDGPAFGGFTDELSASGTDLSLIARWAPGAQSNCSVFSTVGLFKWSQDVRYVDPTGVYEYDDKGTSFSFGAGVEFGLGAAGKSGVHFDYQMFTNVGDIDNSGHEYDRSFISVGYDYRFGR